MALRGLIIVAIAARVASAQPGLDPASALHDANAAAGAGDWARVTALTVPVMSSPGTADRAEAFRLHGLAAFFENRKDVAERDFVMYLRLDPDGHLDPALYPPEAITFFDDVHARHAPELRRLPKRYAVLTLLPPFAQFQNGDRTKGWVITGLLGAFAAANITTYFVLRSWCHDGGDTCDRSGANHFSAAQRLEVVNIVAGVALIGTYLYGVYDGVANYRARSQLYVMPESGGATVGIAGSF
ncbi:MAG TPA: hypothetical protein VH143_20095 [Kofleriaceae bacterium]|nr:hypothetical protein [Kofleriaceae bacterium]